MAAAAPPAGVRAAHAPPPRHAPAGAAPSRGRLSTGPRAAPPDVLTPVPPAVLSPVAVQTPLPPAVPRVYRDAAAAVAARTDGGSSRPTSSHRCPPTGSPNPARPLPPRWLFPAARRRPPEARGGAQSTAACGVAPASVPRLRVAARRTVCSRVAKPRRHPACRGAAPAAAVPPADQTCSPHTARHPTARLQPPTSRCLRSPATLPVPPLVSLDARPASLPAAAAAPPPRPSTRGPSSWRYSLKTSSRRRRRGGGG